MSDEEKKKKIMFLIVHLISMRVVLILNAFKNGLFSLKSTKEQDLKY